MDINISYSCISDVGTVRKINQDNFLCEGSYNHYENDASQLLSYGRIKLEKPELFGVFDGMGGEDHGEIASYIAAKTASEYPLGEDLETSLNDMCFKANDEICRYTASHNIYSMGTTLAAVAFAGDKIVICNIGDSKIYKLEDGYIRKVSMDHLAFAPYGVKPPLSQNLGIAEDEMIIEPFIDSFSYESTGTFLICSDGLTDALSDDTIAEIICANSLDAAADELTRQAKAYGSRDNITVLLVRYTSN